MDHWVAKIKHIEERSLALSTLNPIMFEPLKIYLKAKYVDDVVKALEQFRHGVRWSKSNQAFIWTQEARLEDEGANLEQITMREVSEMASNMVKCLRFTWDCPSLHTDKRMPVLDTTMWIGIPRGNGSFQQL